MVLYIYWYNSQRNNYGNWILLYNEDLFGPYLDIIQVILALKMVLTLFGYFLNLIIAIVLNLGSRIHCQIKWACNGENIQYNEALQ